MEWINPFEKCIVCIEVLVLFAFRIVMKIFAFKMFNNIFGYNFEINKNLKAKKGSAINMLGKNYAFNFDVNIVISEIFCTNPLYRIAVYKYEEQMFLSSEHIKIICLVQSIKRHNILKSKMVFCTRITILSCDNLYDEYIETLFVVEMPLKKSKIIILLNCLTLF